MSVLLDNELYWLVSSYLGMHVVLVKNRTYMSLVCVMVKHNRVCTVSIWMYKHVFSPVTVIFENSYM